MEKLNLSYLTAAAAKSYAFYMIPKELVDNPVFDYIDYGGKLLYGMMLSRASLSATNPDFIDDNGNVYIIYTIEQIMESMRCARQTAVNMLKQLDDSGLIEKKRRGQGKPSLLYIKDFSTVNAEEVQNIDLKKSKKQTSKNLKEKTFKNLKNRLEEVQNIDPNHNNLNHNDQSQNNLSYNDSIDSEMSVDNSLNHKPTPSDNDLRFADKSDNFNQSYTSNLNFDYLNTKYINRHAELQEIRNLIFQTLMANEHSFRIAKKPVPAYQVKEALQTLSLKHIEYVLNNSLKHKSDVKNHKAYLLTSLFNVSKLKLDDFDVDSVRNAVKNNIYLESLLSKYANHRKELYEIYDIVVETLLSHKKTFRIAKGELPSQLVKQAFAKLTDQHIEYVLSSLNKTTTEVKSVKAYIQTSLYNSTQTINNHTALDVNKWLYEHLGIEPK
jgi:predicted transcriptional regulator